MPLQTRYINLKQQEFLKNRKPIKLFRAGRGTGKTHIIGAEKRISAAEFPQGKEFLAAATYAQILTKTLPELMDVWRGFGLIENVHYVVGKRPPKHWIKPYKSPKLFKNVVSFYNGFCIELMSLDRADLSRGGSFDGGDIDEGLLCSWDDIATVILPTLRGNRDKPFHYLRDAKGRILRNKQGKPIKNPRHHQLRIYSSVAWKSKGRYINDWEKKMEKEPNEFGLVTACTMDNVAVLGLKYIERLKAALTPQQYNIEVLNIPVMKVPDGFYHKFSTDTHCEMSYEYNDTATGITVKGDKHYTANAPIDFTVDFGGRINCGLAIQHKEKDNTIRVLKEFFVKDEKKIRELVQSFCEYYADHKNKLVRLWGEPRGNDNQPDGEAFYKRMKALFALRGWACQICATTSAKDQIVRHNIINDILSETDRPRMPRVRVSDEKCQNFVISLQITGIKDDYTKEKKTERDPNFPQEHAPHFTDAFDNYITQNYDSLFGGYDLSWIGNYAG